MSETYLGAGSGAIRHHYDVGNDFWQVWLDPTMSYSCAMWADPADDLETAQRRKLDFHAEQARAAGIGTLTLIGDCVAPGTIAAAVYSGHRMAREFDAPVDSLLVRREIPFIEM